MLKSLLFILLTLATVDAHTQANYTKTAEIPALRVSFTELQAVIDKTVKLTSSTNSSSKVWREGITMKAGSIQVNISGRSLVPANAKIPDQINAFTYVYSTADQSPVSRVNLDFDDFRRTLTVEGSSPEQVEAIFAATREDLMNLSSSVGGSGQKSLLGIIASSLLLPTMLYSGIGWFIERRPKSLAIFLTVLATTILIFILPTGELLTGFMATRSEPSLMVRYGPQISFISLILTVVGIPITVYQIIGARKPAKENLLPAQPHASASGSVGRRNTRRSGGSA